MASPLGVSALLLGLCVTSALTGGPEGCETDEIVAEPAPRHAALVNLTGGAWGSVCRHDWYRVLEDESLARWPKARFVLTRRPVEATIAVWVGGVAAPAVHEGVVNWTYNSYRNAIVFTPFAIPEAGARIVVSYRVEAR